MEQASSQNAIAMVGDTFSIKSWLSANGGRYIPDLLQGRGVSTGDSGSSSIIRSGGRGRARHPTGTVPAWLFNNQHRADLVAYLGHVAPTYTVMSLAAMLENVGRGVKPTDGASSPASFIPTTTTLASTLPTNTSLLSFSDLHTSSDISTSNSNGLAVSTHSTDTTSTMNTSTMTASTSTSSLVIPTPELSIDIHNGTTVLPTSTPVVTPIVNVLSTHNINSNGFTNSVRMVDYTGGRSVAVLGDTRPIKDWLKEAGGRFNMRLTDPVTGVVSPGWIFTKNQKEFLETELQRVYVAATL